MANVLPQHAQKRMSRMYIGRVVAVVAGCFALWMVLMSLALTPLYARTSATRTAALIEHAVQKEQQEKANRNATVRTQDLEKMRNAIDRAYTHNLQVAVGTILDRWGTHAEDIIITSITYEVVAEEEKKKTVEKEYIRISGEARTRKALDAFLRDIRSVPAFKKVDLPISDLASDRDVAFSVTIFYAP